MATWSGLSKALAERAKVASSKAQRGEAVVQIRRAKGLVLAAYPARPRSVAK